MFKKKEIALALAGGGCKALYGLGVGRKLREWGLKIKEISGVSAGSAMALVVLSENEEESIEYFEELVKRNPKNFHISRIFSGRRPFPHEQMYRRTIRYSIDIDKILETGAKIFILSNKAFPRHEEAIYNYWNKLVLVPQTIRAVILDDKDMEKGLPAHRVEKIINKWNISEVTFTEEDFQYPEMVEQIVMNSSSVPPVIRFQRIHGEYYFDGGLTNNLFLERFSPNLKWIGVYYEDNTLHMKKNKNLLERTFLIRPEGRLPISTFDYTNAIKARMTYELGKSDAEKNKLRIMEFLEQ